MRGKAKMTLPAGTYTGITPAYAGKSSPSCCGSWRCRDHPRVCGEKLLTCERMLLFLGSPPRMRGKVDGLIYEHWQAGITPAYAGKRYRSKRTQLKRRDHPRVCGEKTVCPVACAAQSGSPPRMRGKAFVSSVSAKCTGITPAYAGKSLCCLYSNTFLWDHPRVCGEKYLKEKPTLGSLGSPPRMRGKD